MRKVFKYTVPLNEEFSLDIPWGAKILTVQALDGEPFVWALVDPDARARAVPFRLANTGEAINEAHELRYVGTFQLRDGGLVYHLFEVLK
jgi:hypothetical protein